MNLEIHVIPGLGQIHRCGGIKHVNGIPNHPPLITGWVVYHHTHHSADLYLPGGLEIISIFRKQLKIHFKYKKCTVCRSMI